MYRTPVIEAPADEFVHTVEVSIASGSGLDVRYTRDGSQPTASSERYTGPFEIEATATVRAIGTHAGQPVTATVERTFTRVVPRPALEFPGARPGLRREKFGGVWERLPEFGSMTPLEVGVAETVALPAREERVGYRFSGLVEVEHDDVYTFSLASDDGSRLWIDGELVVDNDGLHGTVEKRGHVALAAGAHALRVDWFNGTGGAELVLKCAALGEALHALPASRLRHVP